MPRRSTSPLASPPDITFLPVNQSHSPNSNRVRRRYQSCDNCRQKKKRCEPSSQALTCWRCQQESRICLTTHRRKRRRPQPSVGSTTSGPSRLATANMVITPASPSAGNPPQGSDSSTYRHTAEGTPSDLQVVPTLSGNLPWVSNTKERIISTSILDACDALDLVAVAGSRENLDADGLREGNTHQGSSAASHQSAYTKPLMMPSAKSWDQFFLIKRGIIQAQEAVEYLGFYFAHLWHLFPVVPQWYSSPDRYGSLATDEPVLTISIMTIASRYHALSGFNGQARSERVHWRTWPWVQRLFQSSMWGLSAMRSHGAIAALLLFIEWHPRAINSTADLMGDCGDLELFEPQYQTHEGEPQHAAASEGANRRPDLSSVPERLNIVAPAYRSNKMSWMMLSTAVSLAQELGCFSNERTPARAPPGDDSERLSVRQEWTRILCTFLRLTDEALALRLRLEPQLASSCCVEIDRLPSNLIADGFSENTVDLAPHMRKARELLNSWRRSQQGTGPAVSISAWTNFIRGLDSWAGKRHLAGTGESKPLDLSLRGVCLEIEYYYIRLCGLSPAAHTFGSIPDTESRNLYTQSLSQFAEEATRASVNMLELLVKTSSPSKVFRYAAVRYWLYTFCASLYLLKVTLISEEQLDSTNPFIKLIVRAIEAMKQNAPDDIHMSQRYATLLDIIVTAALQTPQTGSARGSNRDSSCRLYSHPIAHMGYSFLVLSGLGLLAFSFNLLNLLPLRYDI
ncbi:hypothetical protein BJY04DRAFT_211006 [Aspergillus karnatakaensis]|uniref:uncharacterized protein n=1 Tax=Aspergillus karnatakaensis TaxID=1810916 RepID=UPI003CCCA67E